MNIRIVLGVLLAVFAISTKAQISESKIYLKCTPDSGTKLSVPTELLIDKKTLQGNFVKINEKMQFNESETEYFSQIESGGKVSFKFAVNKFTLRYASYNIANVWVKESPSIFGQCEIQVQKM